MNNVCDITRPDVPCAVTTTGPALLPIFLFTLFVAVLAVAGLILVIRAARKK